MEGQNREGRALLGKEIDAIEYSIYTTRCGLDNTVLRLPWQPRGECSIGQGGLACCDSWGRKESDTTERLN